MGSSVGIAILVEVQIKEDLIDVEENVGFVLFFVVITRTLVEAMLGSISVVVVIGFENKLATVVGMIEIVTLKLMKEFKFNYQLVWRN